MGVRFVAVGRVGRDTEMEYTSVVVVYGKGVAPDVRATVTLPPEVVYEWAIPTPDAPPGTDGVVKWSFGDLSVNQSFQVGVRVRSDLVWGTRFKASLVVTNGLGRVYRKTRMSRVGRISSK